MQPNKISTSAIWSFTSSPDDFDYQPKELRKFTHVQIFNVSPYSAKHAVVCDWGIFLCDLLLLSVLTSQAYASQTVRCMLMQEL